MKIGKNIFKSSASSVKNSQEDDREYCVCETDKIYVYILRFKCGKTPEMFFIKRVRFVILAFYNLLGVHAL